MRTNIKSRTWIRTVRVILWVLFALYCLVLIKLLFLNGRPYRGGGIASYLNRISWMPFKTIGGYLRLIGSDRLNPGIALRNLLGNIALFLPMGCFLPCLFEKMQTWRSCVLALLGMILAAELLQLILGVGILDVDDVLLNLFGGLIGFLLISLPPMKKILQKCSVRQASPQSEKNE